MCVRATFPLVRRGTPCASVCVCAVWQLIQHLLLPGTSTAKCFLHFDTDEEQIYYFHFAVFVFVIEEARSLYYFSTVYSLGFSTDKNISALKVNILCLKIHLNVNLMNIQHLLICITKT